MKRQIKMLLSAAISIALLSGCVGTSTQESTSVENTSTTVESDTSKAAKEDEATFPRTYTDARGKKVTIEKKPERIAVTTWMITEKLLAIEVPPVAADTLETMSSWASMKEYLEKYQIEDLGTEVNLERLLELQPDLILATQANENIYDKLEAIAPVIVFDVNQMFGDWQASTREVAMALGEEESAEEFINNLMGQITTSKEEISMDGKTVGFLRLWSNTIYSMGIETCAAYYDEDNGLGLSTPENWPEEIGALSLEALTQINPDYIFISISEDEAYMEELKSNAVWNSLTAVKEGHVYPIDISALSGGALASKYGIEVVAKALTE
jgi:iron complex transport system substrate-binding protein